MVFFFEVPATLDEAHDSDEPSFSDPLLKTSSERIMQAFGEIRDERLQHLALDILMHLAEYSRSARI